MKLQVGGAHNICLDIEPVLKQKSSGSVIRSLVLVGAFGRLVLVAQ